ncbi:MAG: hypothetical protein ACN6QC_26765, partial [Paraburkholderia hospita]
MWFFVLMWGIFGFFVCDAGVVCFRFRWRLRYAFVLSASPFGVLAFARAFAFARSRRGRFDLFAL